MQVANDGTMHGIVEGKKATIYGSKKPEPPLALLLSSKVTQLPYHEMME